MRDIYTLQGDPRRRHHGWGGLGIATSIGVIVIRLVRSAAARGRLEIWKPGMVIQTWLPAVSPQVRENQYNHKALGQSPMQLTHQPPPKSAVPGESQPVIQVNSPEVTVRCRYSRLQPTGELGFVILISDLWR